ncbi:unnamed protein product [Ilex paraguariensis]|uniref:U5 small nuclear ribonucleoprotein TSSC4 n=1 Tax=Ilex paraguariensis TaxID=185542 RepID=A0ABC8T9S0_9AQUA
MEDSFRVRVDRAFGSLASSSTSSSLSSLWCLSDEEIQKIEWNRHKESLDDELESKPYPPNLDGFFANQSAVNFQNDLPQDPESDPQDLNDDCDYGDQEREENQIRDLSLKTGDEDWDIRSSIGLDCTLDYEEEEDEYDKVAVGREKAGDQLCTSDIYDYGPGINSYNELPNRFRDVTRDPRANHMVAKIRLQEDAEAAGRIDSLRVCDDTAPRAARKLEAGVDPKPILKKRGINVDSRSPKRVRFDPGCKNNWEEEAEGAKDLQMETSAKKDATMSDDKPSFPRHCSGVPDYILNPSNYIHYTFDSSNDIDEESNREAYMDFFNMLKKPSTTESQLDDTSTDLPRSLAFVPKKKPCDTSTVGRVSAFKQNEEDVSKRKALPISIAAGDGHENEVCGMEEDEPETDAEKRSSLRGSGRQYRVKASVDLCG